MAWRMLWHDLSPGEATLGINPTRETVCVSKQAAGPFSWSFVVR